MNTIPAQELKRRGIGAIDTLLAKGDVHVIRNNQPRSVVLAEQRTRPLQGPTVLDSTTRSRQ